MYLYRTKEIGNRDRLNEICLRLIERGDSDQLYEILPHLRIIRSPLFFDPLIRLFTEGNLDQKAVAALALGCLGDEKCISILCRVYEQEGTGENVRSQALRSAILEALGELPTRDSADALIRLAAESPEKCEKSGDPETVISSLGYLAQQGIEEAEEQLIRLMSSTRSPAIASLSLTEVLVAYWHRPDAVPESLLEKVVDIASNNSGIVARSAMTALSSLVRLGNERARLYLERIESTSTG